MYECGVGVRVCAVCGCGQILASERCVACQKGNGMFKKGRGEREKRKNERPEKEIQSL